MNSYSEMLREKPDGAGENDPNNLKPSRITVHMGKNLESDDL